MTAAIITAIFAGAALLAYRVVRMQRASGQLTGRWEGSDGVVALSVQIEQTGTDLTGSATVNWPQHLLTLELTGWNDSTGRIFLMLRDPLEERTMHFTARLTPRGVITGNFDGEFANPAPLLLTRRRAPTRTFQY